MPSERAQGRDCVLLEAVLFFEIKELWACDVIAWKTGASGRTWTGYRTFCSLGVWESGTHLSSHIGTREDTVPPAAETRPSFLSLYPPHSHGKQMKPGESSRAERSHGCKSSKCHQSPCEAKLTSSLWLITTSTVSLAPSHPLPN